MVEISLLPLNRLIAYMATIAQAVMSNNALLACRKKMIYSTTAAVMSVESYANIATISTLILFCQNRLLQSCSMRV